MLEKHQEIGWRSLPVLLTAAMAYAIVYFDQGMISVAMPAIQSGLSLKAQMAGWVLQIYFLVMAILAVCGGYLGDRMGLKQSYLLGASLFALGSLLSAVSHSVFSLLLGRIIQAMGAAFMMPVSQAIIYRSFSGHLLGRAMGYYGGIAVCFLSIGPYIGGQMVLHGAWSRVFYMDASLAGLTVFFASFFLPHFDRAKQESRFDWIGQILFVVILASLACLLAEFSTSLSLGAALLVLPAMLLFYRVERRHASPLFDFRFMHNKSFLFATILLFWVQLVLMVSVVFAAYLQVFQNLSSEKAGFILLICTLLQMVLNPLSGWATDRFGSKRLILLGITGLGVGLYGLAGTVSSASYLHCLPWLVLYSIAFPFVFTATFKLVMRSVSLDQQAVAAGIGFTARQMGGALGLMIIDGLWLNRQHVYEFKGVSHHMAYAHGFSTVLMAIATSALLILFFLYGLLYKSAGQAVVFEGS